MKKITIGQRLFVGVLTIFLFYAVVFILYQQSRERQYKVDTLNLQMQNFNTQLEEELRLTKRMDVQSIHQYVDEKGMQHVRVTLIDTSGHVFFDNTISDFKHMPNHLGRPEVKQALSKGQGAVVERNSKTTNCDYFYSATFFPSQGLIVRSAMPYGDDLSNKLRTDQHFIWISLVAVLLLSLLLYHFTHRLGENITKLRMFASRADLNESLEVEDLAEFPDDELGEIAERIIKLYKRLQTTQQEQNILKRQLTQNIAHELKTPVAGIRGYLETILDNPNINEEHKQQFLQRCYMQCERLTSLLHDISTLNRLDDASDMLGLDEVDLVPLIQRIQNEMALQLTEHHMTLFIDIPESIKMMGNSDLLYSVFRNLMDNAVAYSGEGTAVFLTANKEGDFWNFVFYDTGQGVPEEHLSRLFERFYRIDKGRSRKMGGTGLGLAIVKNAVLFHGGTIHASNRPEGGLRFDFTLHSTH